MLYKNNVLRFLAYLIICILFTFLLSYVYEIYNISFENESGITDDLKRSPYFYTFIIVLFAPFFEEVMFRLPLKKNRYFMISILLLFGYSFAFELILTKVLIYIFIVILLLKKIATKVNFYKSIYFYSIFIFGLIHIENYEIDSITSVSFFELISMFISQIFLGVFITDLRLRFNLITGFAFHSIYNGILTITFLLTN